MKKLGKIRCESNRSASENARSILPRLVRRYFRYGRAVVRKKDSARNLHRLRLETKRCRYTLEIFAPVYGPSLAERIASLRRIQEYLGQVNDIESIEGFLHDGKSKPPGSVAPLIGRLDKESEKHARAFRQYWETTFDAPGQLERWIAYLGRFAGGARAKKRA
ncbi:MAG: CHAD domain-containing protein [Bryobacteraceae bacterium]